LVEQLAQMFSSLAATHRVLSDAQGAHHGSLDAHALVCGTARHRVCAPVARMRRILAHQRTLLRLSACWHDRRQQLLVDGTGRVNYQTIPATERRNAEVTAVEVGETNSLQARRTAHEACARTSEAVQHNKHKIVNWTIIVLHTAKTSLL
jgi:hypothetical protein